MNLLKKINIDNVALENNIFLAPMAGITDLPFRILCKEQGVGLVHTEMISAKGMYYSDLNTHKLSELSPLEYPASIQIFGSDPKIMAEVTQKLNDSKASFIDINMGCPAPKITKNGEGSALMLNPKLIGEIIRAVSSVSIKPVTVKIRKGYTVNNVNAVEIAKIAEDSGAKAITVHGRTRDQYYSGKADWEIIKKVKESVSIPVIGNGDIWCPENAKEMLLETNCDAVMIGRGSLGNPWIIKRIAVYLNEGILLPEPTIKEKIELTIRHLNMMVSYKGQHTGLVEMRKHIAWYIKGIKNAATVKDKVFKMTDKNEIIDLLMSLV